MHANPMSVDVSSNAPVILHGCWLNMHCKIRKNKTKIVPSVATQGNRPKEEDIGKLNNFFLKTVNIKAV